MIVGAGTFGASLAWWLAGRGDEVVLVDQFEPGRPARDLRRRDAADPLRARGGRRLHGDGAAGAGRCGASSSRSPARAADRDRRVLVRARQERLGGRVPADAEEAQDPGRALVGGRRGEAVPEPSTATTSRGSCTSPRRASCAPRRPCGRSCQQARPAARRSCRARRSPTATPRSSTARATRATGSCGQRRLAAPALPRPGPAARDPAGAVLLRRRAGLAQRAGLGRLRPRDLRHARPRTRSATKVAWDSEGPAIGPDDDLPARRPTRRRRSPAATWPTASPRSPRRRWPGARRAATSSRADSIHRRARTRSTRRVWLVGGGSGHGFKHGPALAERIAAAWDGGAPLPAHFALGERASGASFRSAGSNF